MESIARLNRLINACRRCPLYKTAHLAVPGEGNPKAKIIFIGEAPGRHEDETGRPFIGRAGKLLDSLLTSINVGRNSVFITSIIKHRPLKNRQPKPGEIKACRYWLKKQLDIINPKIIVTLGRVSLAYFIPGEKISKIHGTMIMSRGEDKYPIFPIYHPAAGLRSTRNKLALFRDFEKLLSHCKNVIY